MCTVSNPEGQNASLLCIRLKVTGGRLDIDRAASRLARSQEFNRRLSITPAEAEEFVFNELQKLLLNLKKPYRVALSDEETALDDQGQLNDPLTNGVREANKEWAEFITLFSEWAEAGPNRRGIGEIFPEAEATNAGGLIEALAKADQATALLVYETNGYDPDEGVIRFAVTDPISDWGNSTQVELRLPGVPAGAKRDERLQRLRGILLPLRGVPRCRECIGTRLATFYRRLGLTPNIIFDNVGTSPLIITVIEAARIVGISWSLDRNNEDIDKVLYSLLTHDAFNKFLSHREEIISQKRFDYVERTGKPGPYLNQKRLQIQQLLVNQLGYTVSFAFAPNQNEPLGSNYRLTIQKTSDLEAAGEEETRRETQNEAPEPAPALATEEGVVTGHEQEKKAETEFVPEVKPREKVKDKKRFLGGGLDYQPGQGVRFYGLGQLSRFPFLPDSLNNLSAKGGGQGADGGLGTINYFADYLFFNNLHRRLSVQLTVASDLDADRILADVTTDERRRNVLARVELEPFRDWNGNLFRLFAEGRRATVALKPQLQPELKQNLTTLELGALYLFESSEVEHPRRIRLEPKLRMGLGLAVGEPRYNKVLTTGNFHQTLPGRFEMDFTGRFESASRQTPLFELPSFGGTEVVRGFRRDDALGRKLWSLQSELWVPLPIGDERSKGLESMLRENVKLAPFVDVGGLYEPVNTTAGTRSATGLGLRMIYNPIIFKIDYAYGFGAAASSGSRGKLHFGVSSNLPF